MCAEARYYSTETIWFAVRLDRWRTLTLTGANPITLHVSSSPEILFCILYNAERQLIRTSGKRNQKPVKPSQKFINSSFFIYIYHLRRTGLPKIIIIIVTKMKLNRARPEH